MSDSPLALMRAALLAPKTSADRGTLLGPTWSYHMNRDYPYNEQHPGIGYMTPKGYGAYTYRNSHDRSSVMVGKEFRHPLNQYLDLAGMVGAVTGYPAAAVLPVLMPGLVGKLGDHELALMLQPEIKGKTDGALSLQYRRRLR